MRILAIETSGRTGSLAALTGQEVGAGCLRNWPLEAQLRTAQTLAPALDGLLAAVGWPARSVELVAVAAGPGSFTGLRIGVTTAKTFAYAVEAKIIGVDTLAVLAAQAPAAPAPLWTIMDAQRQELFAAKFAPSTGGKRSPLVETTIIAEQSWLDALAPGDHVTGPPLARLRDRLPAAVIPLQPQEIWQPMAEAVGQVAWHAFQQGRRDDVWSLVPQYFRLSAAEEKRGRQGEGETRRL